MIVELDSSIAGQFSGTAENSVIKNESCRTHP